MVDLVKVGLEVSRERSPGLAASAHCVPFKVPHCAALISAAGHGTQDYIAINVH